MPGLLIVLEGAEGAGKTTQVSLLARRFEASGTRLLVLREPGGTALGDSLRHILLDAPGSLEAPSEALLFMASRAELVRRRIDPALADGVIVLMDRFFLSTYAYQVAGRGLPEEEVRAANSLATHGLVPSLTMVITVPAKEGMARATRRGAHDRIERSGAEFHDRVEKAFATFASPDWQRAHPECGRIVPVDGNGSPDEVFTRVVSALAQNLPELSPMIHQTTPQ
ncbi:MAG: dTMP kinase [Gemmatimonadota bacterium]|nr:dTMP kinase [Gemmatimonadota bacterium]